MGNNRYDVMKDKKFTDYFENHVLADNNDEYDEYLDNIKRYARFLKDNQFSTSMIRKVYAKVLRVDNHNDLKKLRPQFAYIAGRNSGKAIRKFMDLLEKLIKKINNDKDIDKFTDFLEAIVAYMKYYGDNK